ncbi:DUF742 domain-containing protein [Streptomyces lavenduligriseus]|uniref:DUF742 domain-containing protein n=1 Tax=Streptomyces lavenduligriseus TaxID=67315 RepID=A0ABT0P560_9ACTN|nr:DUF742 domain-containing protein [Streptomyces lavenduligriseus]MCL3998864.1 DUF742 domain-containing protein [Streptomyces lavenduligriseus]
MAPDNSWSDSLLRDVRPYTLTGGRTRSPHPLDLTTCLLARPSARLLTGLSPESESLLLHCTGTVRSLAEIAALLQQPVQIVKVLVGDLLDCDALELATPVGFDREPVETALLEALLEGLQRL